MNTKFFFAEICSGCRSCWAFWRKWLVVVFFRVVGVEGRSGFFEVCFFSKTGALPKDYSHLRDFWRHFEIFSTNTRMFPRHTRSFGQVLFPESSHSVFAWLQAVWLTDVEKGLQWEWIRPNMYFWCCTYVFGKFWGQTSQTSRQCVSCLWKLLLGDMTLFSCSQRVGWSRLMFFTEGPKRRRADFFLSTPLLFTKLELPWYCTLHSFEPVAWNYDQRSSATNSQYFVEQALSRRFSNHSNMISYKPVLRWGQKNWIQFATTSIMLPTLSVWTSSF